VESAAWRELVAVERGGDGFEGERKPEGQVKDRLRDEHADRGDAYRQPRLVEAGQVRRGDDPQRCQHPDHRWQVEAGRLEMASRLCDLRELGRPERTHRVDAAALFRLEQGLWRREPRLFSPRSMFASGSARWLCSRGSTSL